MARKWLLWAGLHGFCAVALGAFAAHGLKGRLEPEMLALVETGARYQMYGALSLLGMTALEGRFNLKFSAWCFAIGTLIFSGSLYVLAFSGVKALGAVTPLGGLLLLAGWLWLARAAQLKAPI